eukprot:Sdes_comp16599_c0_seq1m5908
MADNNVVEEHEDFDLSLKRKKKKKKAFESWDFEEDTEITEKVAELSVQDDEKSSSTQQNLATQNQDNNAPVEDEEIDDFNLSLKKKKKKKKVTIEEEKSSHEGQENPDQDEEDEEEAVDGDDFLSLKKKKKKKTRTVDPSREDAFDLDHGDRLDSDPWSGSDRDYTYTELLSRVFDLMRAKNPDLAAGVKRRFVMKPPQVVRIGTKKSAFVNFAEICKLLHRQPDHLLAFLFSELGTSGSLDGNNQLTIKGRFQQKQIENVLRRYIREYVTCHTCRSPDTILTKENRIFFLQCEVCGSRCSVAAIKSGFQAVTSKRAQIRAQQ